jgi:hypothetical protein
MYKTKKDLGKKIVHQEFTKQNHDPKYQGWQCKINPLFWLQVPYKPTP